MFIFEPVHRILLITGHYGAGKTNVAVNLALLLRKRGLPVTLIDLDTVNPYFRAADSLPLLRDNGVSVIVPDYANTNVDIPSLPPDINRVFGTGSESDHICIFDVGGSDGAVALGMYRTQIEAAGYDMYCVINNKRPLIASPDDAASEAREIEQYCGLTCTGIINNSCLGAETTFAMVEESIPYAEKTAEILGVPMLFTTVIETEECRIPDGCQASLFPIQNATKQLYYELHAYKNEEKTKEVFQ